MNALPTHAIGAFLVTLVLGTSLVAQPDELTIPQIVERVSPSTVAILGDTGFGSGVVVSRDGYIITNFHVIENQGSLNVGFPDGPLRDNVRRVAERPDRDLALLKIDATDLIPVRLGDASEVRQGETIVVIGHPEGLIDTVSSGILTGFETSGTGMFDFAENPLRDGTRLFQTDAAASSGNSGGGMFNDRGELIGIMTSQFLSGQNLNFGIPVNYVDDFIRPHLGMTTDRRGSQPLPEIPDDGLNADNNAFATTSTQSAETGSSRDPSWRALFLLLPLAALLIAWFIRQEHDNP